MAEEKIALITGIAGQDGALLAALLQEKGYRVHGLVRWDSHLDPLDGLARLDGLGLVDDDIMLHTGDITDFGNMTALIKDVQPDEIYNLAALSHVAVSFGTPSSALDINAKGALNILESVRVLGMERRTRIYQASSSEMFGHAPAPQNEETKMQPCSPYGAAKLAAYHLARIYRESYNMHVSNGILFNHESPLRGQDFVTAKIARVVAGIEAGVQARLSLGNLNAVRDWGHAKDYVRGMWLMLQQKKPGDYVLATGEAHSVRDFTEKAFAHIGIKLHWRGNGAKEQGLDTKTDHVLVEIDPALYRPNEVHHLLGDASKACEKLSWRPETTFDELVSEMVNQARSTLRKGKKAWRKAS